MTSADACARWAEIADRLAVGDDVGEIDAAYLRRHARGCDACAEEARVYMDLEALIASPEEVHEKVRAEPIPSWVVARRRVSTRALALGAAVLAVAASTLFFLRDRATPNVPAEVASAKPAPTAPLAVPAPVATVTLLEGNASVDGSHAGAGGTVAAGALLATTDGRACVKLDPGVRVCLAKATRVRIENLEGPARVLRLEAGRVAAELEPQAPGTSFSIAAGDGRVTAIGTAFSVEMDGKMPLARVSHGVVLVRAKDAERRVHAHETVRFGEDVRPLPTVEEDADRTLLRQGVTVDAPAPARLTLDSSPAGAMVMVDGAQVGATPLDVLVAPGKHQVTIAGAEAPVGVDLRAGEHFAKAWLLAPAKAAPVQAPVVVAPAPPSPSSLLTAAQSAGSQGDSVAAARAYRSLLVAHPDSAEATAAMLSLGDLELSSGDASAALAHYDRYLARRGPLALEARYGRIRALDRLGRKDEAAAATTSFVHDYAGTPQADALRSRAP